jgi:hypothetical protein
MRIPPPGFAASNKGAAQRTFDFRIKPFLRFLFSYFRTHLSFSGDMDLVF